MSDEQSARSRPTPTPTTAFEFYQPPASIAELIQEIEARKTLSLWQKIAAMIGECKRIPKNGWNEHFRFAYATQADTVAMTSQLCAKFGVTIVSQPVPFHSHLKPIVEAFTTKMLTASGEDLTSLSSDLKAFLSVWRKPEHEEWTDKQELTSMLFEFTVTNADNPEENFSRYAWGEGMDSMDKGTFKAWTGAEKYFMFKLFQIPTGDEPDASGMRDGERKRERYSQDFDQREVQEHLERERNRRGTQQDKQNLKPGDANRGHGAEKATAAVAASEEISGGASLSGWPKSEPPMIAPFEVDITTGKGDRAKTTQVMWFDLVGTVIANTGVRQTANGADVVYLVIGSMKDYKDNPTGQHARFVCYHKHLHGALAKIPPGANVRFHFYPEVSGDKAQTPGAVTQYIEDLVWVENAAGKRWVFQGGKLAEKREDEAELAPLPGLEMPAQPAPKEELPMGETISPPGLFAPEKKAEPAEDPNKATRTKKK